eukprot:Hpha_TRINITY_DN15780_c1_g8::TRINITY_DN15780_c1_g8_i1::g.41751::m.41751/K03695/clpB; ATP-dependent Clp protease ATP-binding subunit ClpB
MWRCPRLFLSLSRHHRLAGSLRHRPQQTAWFVTPPDYTDCSPETLQPDICLQEAIIQGHPPGVADGGCPREPPPIPPDSSPPPLSKEGPVGGIDNATDALTSSDAQGDGVLQAACSLAAKAAKLQAVPADESREKPSDNTAPSESASKATPGVTSDHDATAPCKDLPEGSEEPSELDVYMTVMEAQGDSKVSEGAVHQHETKVSEGGLQHDTAQEAILEEAAVKVLSDTMPTPKEDEASKKGSELSGLADGEQENPAASELESPSLEDLPLEDRLGLPPLDPPEDIKRVSPEAATDGERLVPPEPEPEKLSPLEELLRRSIVGQAGAVQAVTAAIRRKENGWHDSNKPLVFLLLGPSGIGKTELAKSLASYLFPDEDVKEDAFIRIDMSEYQSQHEVAKFIGSPPGYVGHEEGGQLTQRLQEHRNAVVLLDEVEKAHQDVLTIMLHLFDEGRITDGRGQLIDCRDAIFVMTSNLAQREIADEAIRARQEERPDAPKKPHTKIRRKVREEIVGPILREAFGRDEFLGRINETLYFLPFTDEELDLLVEKELETWRGMASSRHGLDLRWTAGLVQFVKAGYNLRYGARSIKHEVERSLISKLASAQEKGRIKKGDIVTLDFETEPRQGRSADEDDREEDEDEEEDDGIQDVKGVVYHRPQGHLVLRVRQGDQEESSMSKVLRFIMGHTESEEKGKK